MAHVIQERTEEEAKQCDWPCWMCINEKRAFGDEKTKWRDSFCQKCKKQNVHSKPSEFYLRKFC